MESIYPEKPKKVIAEGKKNTDIEFALAEGVSKAWDFLLNRAKKLKKNNIPTLGVLLNDPLERRDLMNMLYLFPHQKGWVTKEASKWWKEFAPAFSSEYQNKKLRKIIKKIGNRAGMVSI